ncbi:hypothetical protein TRFO_27875 [Tritrichomonas foetus]|uniref:E2F/DP family winged-helix DNA-binding domain-containing protein n=1 Tax=Tritrichomonas foetus TaxID=1144522 RepID=A0A1J4K1E6_9EUKA|nr:hypothetical protein TRFO_27875 [Tritrichomonas foetus]|eukprot:OHT04608.1 hypothetical protein TRFO_27875 [Tritrichomonas foetus]
MSKNSSKNRNSEEIKTRISHEQRSTEREQFGTFIQRVIRQFELSQNSPVRFADIADCDKRRQSDLFNILDSLEVFGHISNKLIVWRGFGSTTAAFVRYGVQNELRAHTESITQIFRVGQSPSLSTLVIKFISLFIFLGVDSLNIREVVNLISDNPEHAKKVLRRLYLVVFVLEQSGVIEHGYAYSNYMLKQPLDVIVSTIFQEVPRLKMFPEESIEALLNRLDDIYIQSIHKRRRELFSLAISRFEVIE